ncbi:DUF397 domain-containing protein [Streptomyces sp. SP17BM10]|uniref:DUF397 domain-containing protein n=1 Tax=Streptomyces sp. SP17BM10 TaxID=3002530 RepID=UPI002E75AA85|nr:DUF397 domain-containing protein [Streptomyces sp. SP17BM10]MEE1786067.1 DUF397 domain-containing protein [Streptomyces sp. SP17BM10]
MTRPDLSRATWFKSSHSDNGGTCVEVSSDFPGVVPVRDSKDPEGPALVFPADAWQAFVASAAAGEFGSI